MRNWLEPSHAPLTVHSAGRRLRGPGRPVRSRDRVTTRYICCLGLCEGATDARSRRYACEDVSVARRRLRELERRIETTLRDHEVGALLTTIDGIGPQTAARLVAEVGDFTRFDCPGKLAAYVGAIPGIKHSGKSRSNGAMTSLGNARLRCALWMPLLTAVRKNVWLRAYYQRLVAGGKLRKVALVASMRKLLHAIYSVAINRRPFVARLEEVAS
jgi:transposase